MFIKSVTAPLGAILAAGFILCNASVAVATPINSPVATLSGPAIDFEGFAEGTLIDTQFAGVTFSQDDGGKPQIDNSPFFFGYVQNSGVAVLTGSTDGGAPFNSVAGLVMTFDSLVKHVEFFFSDTAPLGTYTISAFGDGAVLLESFDILAANVQPGQWVGFNRSLDIRSVTIDSSIANDAFGIDDVRFIPEPGTLAILGLGLAGLGFARRRKAV